MAGRIIKNGGYILRSLLTTKGDMIVRGDYGPERLPAGAYGDTLVAVGSGEKPFWYSSSSLLKVNLMDSIFENEIGALATQTQVGQDADVGKVSNGTAGQYLKCNGAGNIPSWDAPPKPIGSIWSPVTAASDGAGIIIKGAFPIMRLKNDATAHISLTVPDDFTSIHSAYLFGIGDVDDDSRAFYIATTYGHTGESFYNHQESSEFSVALFSDVFFSINIASLLPDVAANDQIGISVSIYEEGDAGDTGLIGAKFVYNRS
ncbi:hypothetical protein DRN85_08250 [Methanosarcinales archaeon]|nr:MAG: hypothetical protein DRN85_08250 [Methanosarcinales archaeon]